MAHGDGFGFVGRVFYKVWQLDFSMVKFSKKYRFSVMDLLWKSRNYLQGRGGFIPTKLLRTSITENLYFLLKFKSGLSFLKLFWSWLKSVQKFPGSFWSCVRDAGFV